jgi:hypothetical protein
MTVEPIGTNLTLGVQLTVKIKELLSLPHGFLCNPYAVLCDFLCATGNLTLIMDPRHHGKITIPTVLVPSFTHVLLNKAYPFLADKGTCRLQQGIQSRVRASHINNPAIKPKNTVSNTKITVIRVSTFPPSYFIDTSDPFRGCNESPFNILPKLLNSRQRLKELFL